eukprot:4967094-Prymnesium_polylepis.1
MANGFVHAGCGPARPASAEWKKRSISAGRSFATCRTGWRWSSNAPLVFQRSRLGSCGGSA